MKLIWQQKDFDSDIDFILFHQADGTPVWWRRQLFDVYPDLDFNFCNSLPQEKRFDYIRAEMKKQLVARQPMIDEAIQKFRRQWNQSTYDIAGVFGRVFGEKCENILNDMVAQVGLNPICPRDLSTHTFSVFYWFAPDYAIGVAIHEITHFVWFYWWHRYFKDDVEGYNHPHLKWLLSEIVVEPLIRNTEIGTLVPNLAQHKYLAYKYFYEIKIAGAPLYDVINKMFDGRTSMRDFMIKAYNWCVENEIELRREIEKAEQ